MTTTDTFGGRTPTDRRTLRRSRDGRVGAGVAAGLGEYFGLDPVLFRVLFATSAFFGGAGILAYLLAWAAIPESGTERAPIDGWIGHLRRRHVPLWAVAVAVGIFLWVVAFSWWAPGPFVPVIVVGVLITILLARREMRAASPVAPVRLTKDAPAGSAGPAPSDHPATSPSWVGEVRAWAYEARAAGRARRRRTLPMRLAILSTLVLVLTVLGVVDAVSSIELQVYAWTALGIVVIGLLVSAVLRRFPVSVVPLLVPAVLATVAFGGSYTRLHDGIGQREWRPTSGASSLHYRLAFGQGVLDLRHLPAQSFGHANDVARTIDVTVGAGQVQIIAPRSLNLTVLANIHIGHLDVSDRAGASGSRDAHSGVGISRIVDPPAGASGPAVTVDVHLSDGNLTVDHR